MRSIKIFLLALLILAPTAAAAAEARAGRVQASGRALRDSQGEFRALGATMMWALWAYRNDRAWLDRNLSFLSENGFDYIRALGVIDRRIETDPRAYWFRLHMAMEWPDYDEMIAGMTDYVYDKFGMRTEWTIFGGACDFNDSQKQQLIDKFLRMSRGREHKIIHFEVANELHGTCWSGDQGSENLRMWTRYLNDRTDILVAGSSPYGEQCPEMQRIYAGGGVADIGTQHFDRDIGKADGAWRPVRQPWEYPYCTGVPEIGSNNEPIGPGSSVASDTDPWTNVGGAIVSYISGLPLHVYHGEFGVRADHGDYTEYHTEVTTSFAALRNYMPGDVTNWSRQNHHWAGHPFSWSGEVGYPPAQGSGAVRHYATVRGNDFVSFPMGIRDYFRVVAKQPMKFCVVQPLTGQVLDRVSLQGGQAYDLRGFPAFFLRGRMNSSDDGCEADYSVKGRGPGKLVRDQELKPGQSIRSPNGMYELVYQGDNNLVLYRAGRPLWASDTPGLPEPGAVVMQGDGNCVLYDGRGLPLWSSGTAGNENAYLQLGNDGGLGVYREDGSLLKELYVPAVFMNPHASLKPNQAIVFRDLTLVYQGDNNFVLYRAGVPIWATMTHGIAEPGSLEMQGDGNLVIYDRHGVPVWASGTAEYPGASLGLHADGRLILYDRDFQIIRVLNE